MDRKYTFIIIGLVGALAIAAFFSVQFYTGKTKAENEVRILTGERDDLTKQVNEVTQKFNQAEARVSSLTDDMNQLTKDKDELQEKLSVLSKERDELVKQIKKQVESPVEAQAAPRGTGGSDDAYWARILKTNADLELRLNNMKDELRSLQIRNEELQRIKNSLDLEITNLNRDRQDLQKQLEYNQKMIDSVSTELVAERTNSFQIKDTLKNTKNENSMLRRQLSGLNNRKIDLERKVQEIQSEKSELERSVKNMEVMLKGKMDEVCRLKDQLTNLTGGVAQTASQDANRDAVGLPPIVVRPGTEVLGTGRPMDITGKVLSIVEKHNFVIVDLGEETGVRVGNQLKIYRGDSLVADVEVIQVRRDLSACDIKREITPIRVGDIVR